MHKLSDKALCHSFFSYLTVNKICFWQCYSNVKIFRFRQWKHNVQNVVCSTTWKGHGERL